MNLLPGKFFPQGKSHDFLKNQTPFRNTEEYIKHYYFIITLLFILNK